jgi:ketosteroid isomerase-like protein
MILSGLPINKIRNQDMQKRKLINRSILICFFLFCSSSVLLSQTTKTDSELSAGEIQNARKILEDIDKQFSKDYLKGDSVALASFYAKDGQFGSLKGKDILSAWGRSVRSSIKNNTRHLIFTILAVTGDSEFLVELGTFEFKDDNNNIKDSGKYLVVWKKENGEWKIYRDIGL